jgi:hypothetical protein
MSPDPQSPNPEGYFEGAKQEIAERGGRPMGIAAGLGLASIGLSLLLRLVGLDRFFPLWGAIGVGVIVAVALAYRCQGPRAGKLVCIGAVLGGILTGVLALLLAFMAIYMGTFNTKVEFSQGFETSKEIVYGAVLFFTAVGAWGGALAMWVWDEPKAPAGR